jgi:hypothetical protein
MSVAVWQLSAWLLTLATMKTASVSVVQVALRFKVIEVPPLLSTG